MCVASSHPSTSPWPLPARRKVLQTLDLEEKKQQERESHGQPATGSDWTAPGISLEASKNLPPHTRTSQGWACACSPVTSPWWFSIASMKKNEKKQGSMCFFFSFFLSRVKSPSLTPSPSHSPTPRPWLLLKTSSQMVTSYPGPPCDLRSEVSEKEERAWLYPRYQPDLTGVSPLPGFFTSSDSLPAIFPGGISSYSGCRGFYHQQYLWTRR